jgi:adiponectin receptor
MSLPMSDRIVNIRPQSNSVFKSLSSLFYLHNESSESVTVYSRHPSDKISVNVYSHLWGAIALLFTGAYLYHELHFRYPLFTRTDVVMFGIFILSASGCFLLSAFCHLISNHSPPGARVGTSLDYLGIVVFIEGTCVSGFYYGLRAHETLLYAYWAMVCHHHSTLSRYVRN